MSYINDNRQPGETLEYKAAIHWFIFVKPVIVLLLGYLFYSVSTPVLHYTGLLLLLVGALLLIKTIFLKIGAEYVVTNKRVILKSGVFSRNALELVLNKCEGIQIRQSVIGRLLGFGSILVTTGGAVNVFSFVANPIRFRNRINSQIK